MTAVEPGPGVYDALIVGAGPSGISAALWLKLLGLRPLLIEQNKRIGGLLHSFRQPNVWLPGVQLLNGPDYAARLEQHLSDAGVEWRLQGRLQLVRAGEKGFAVEISGLRPASIETRTIVVASGVRPRDGGIAPGPGVILGPGEALDQQEVAGLRVALLGGGDNAAEYYSILNKKKPALVHVYARTWRARPALASLIAPADLFVGAYQVDAGALSIGHRAETRRYDLFAVLYGWQAVIPEALRGRLDAQLDERGFVRVDERRRSAVPGLYVIGEAAQATHPCVATAIADGVIAAKAIEAQLRGVG